MNGNERLVTRPQGLVDILDKILDKGLVVAGDVKVSLANVELLTIQIRLVVCSIDKAESIGINWWKTDRYFSSDAESGGSGQEVRQLQARIDQLERRLNAPQRPNTAQPKSSITRRKGR